MMRSQSALDSHDESLNERGVFDERGLVAHEYQKSYKSWLLKHEASRLAQ